MAIQMGMRFLGTLVPMRGSLTEVEMVVRTGDCLVVWKGFVWVEKLELGTVGVKDAENADVKVYGSVEMMDSGEVVMLVVVSDASSAVKLGMKKERLWDTHMADG